MIQIKVLISYVLISLSFVASAQNIDSVLTGLPDTININEGDSVVNVIDDAIEEPMVDVNNTTGSQESYNDTIVLSFIKDVVTQSPDSLYFNILKIVNYKEEPITGELSISWPDGWNMISAQGNILELLPSDSAYIPIRLAINKESIGALSYILNATFKTDEQIYSANAYISLPGFSRWKIEVEKSIVYFNQYNESEKIKLKISNKGNISENIRLDFKVGSLLLVDGVDKLNNFLYVTVSASKDTVVYFNVKYNNALSYNDRKLFERNWKESSFEINASTITNNQKQTIWFKKLYSSYFGQKIGVSSPLNVGVTFSNLLSDISLRINTELFGTVLLPKDQDIYYRVNTFGLGTDKASYSNFNFNRQFSYILNYTRKNLQVSVGDNVGGGVGIGFSGIGAKVRYKIDKSSSVIAGLMKSKFQKNSFGAFLQYNKKISIISLRSGVGFSKRETPNSNVFSGLLGVGLPFLKMHHIAVDLFGSYLDLKRSESTTSLSQNDTTLIGFGYNVGYSFNYKELSLAANYRNYLKSISNLGNLISIESRYKFWKNKRLEVKYERQKVINGNYLSSIDLRQTYYSNDIGRAVLYIPTKRSVTFGVGPYYNASVRQNLDNENVYLSEIKTYNPKMVFMTNIRFTNYQTLSCYLTSGFANIKYNTEDPARNNITFKGKGSYSIGTTYSTKEWRLNLAYNVGSVTDLWYYINYQIAYPGYTPKSFSNQSILFRPTYEKSFYEDKILLQVMANYIYFMPSKRENISLGANTFFNIGKGWSANLSSNIFVNSVEDEDNGRITTRDINLQVGFRKSFDLQQPRLKHYNLTVICFKDLNGNKIKDENEPPLPNIEVTFERTVPLDDGEIEQKVNTNFALIDLITSPDGEVYYGNIPIGAYRVSFKPLFKLKDIYNVNGEQQIVNIFDGNTTYFVPFAETYKVKGRVIVERDEFSTEGLIFTEGIRVTATSPDGESYSVLTDKNGEYILSVPQAQTYLIKVNQVFGDQFMCEKDEYTVHFNGIKVIKIDFKFIEKKRKVNFSNKIDSLYIFKSFGVKNTTVPNKKIFTEFDSDIDTTQVLRYIDRVLDVQGNKKLGDNDLFPIGEVTDAGIVFKVQIYDDTPVRKTIGELKSLPKVTCIDAGNGNYKYLAGTFRDYKEAKSYMEDLQLLNFTNAKVVAFEDGTEISLQDAGVE